eukprot:m.665506 g.665506  ORF g.665506 m.665506 type:complete len:181 (+) comp58492_c2_seq11:246-788(+)
MTDTHYGRIPEHLKHRVSTPFLPINLDTDVVHPGSHVPFSVPAFAATVDPNFALRLELSELDKTRFGRIFNTLADNNTQRVEQAAIKRCMYHLQELDTFGSFVYMFSETQLRNMIPTKEQCPQGLDLPAFLELMRLTMQDSGWSSLKIMAAFNKTDGHWVQLPCQSRKPRAKPESSCVIA